MLLSLQAFILSPQLELLHLLPSYLFHTLFLSYRLTMIRALMRKSRVWHPQQVDA
jgi:hypothetical protein